MTYLMESSLPILFIGLLATVLAFAGWMQTRKRAFLIAGTLIAALTVIAVIIERAVVTESEELEATVHKIASSMQANQLDATVDFISDQEMELKHQATSILQRVIVKKVSIKPNLKVEIREPGRTARATFNAVARVDDKTGGWKNQTVPRFLIVDFAKQGGQWKVVAYEEKDPRQGLKSR